MPSTRRRIDMGKWVPGSRSFAQYGSVGCGVDSRQQTAWTLLNLSRPSSSSSRPEDCSHSGVLCWLKTRCEPRAKALNFSATLHDPRATNQDRNLTVVNLLELLSLYLHSLSQVPECIRRTWFHLLISPLLNRSRKTKDGTVAHHHSCQYSIQAPKWQYTSRWLSSHPTKLDNNHRILGCRGNAFNPCHLSYDSVGKEKTEKAESIHARPLARPENRRSDPNPLHLRWLTKSKLSPTKY